MTQVRIMESQKTVVALASIRIDGGTQSRSAIYENIVNDYANAIGEGAAFPPIVVFFDGERYWLADGFHRHAAYGQLGLAEIDAYIRQGTRRDAILYSVGANEAHGLRRSNEDKRRAVLTLLNDGEWAMWSDREIARQCQVSNTFVSNLRQTVTVNVDSDERNYTTKHGAMATMKTSAIGKPAADLGLRRDEIFEARQLRDAEIAEPGIVERVIAARTAAREEPTKAALREAVSEANSKHVHVSANSGNNEWYTPPEIVECARRALGAIDFDPASSEVANRTVKAAEYLTENDDGLTVEWRGRTFMNPPYSQPLIGQFCEAAVTKYAAGEITAACVLTNNATETRWLQGLLSKASAVCFIRGRIKYLNAQGVPENTPLQGQCVTYLGPDPKAFMEAFAEMGECWRRG